eukprot:gene35871-46564_t
MSSRCFRIPPMLYQAYQTQSDLLSPLRLMAQHLSASLWLQDTERSVVRKVASACDVISRLRLTHSRPPYNIGEVMVGDQAVPVTEEAVLTLPFGTLLHFRKAGVEPQPPVLLVAPLLVLLLAYRFPLLLYVLCESG